MQGETREAMKRVMPNSFILHALFSNDRVDVCFCHNLTATWVSAEVLALGPDPVGITDL